MAPPRPAKAPSPPQSLGISACRISTPASSTARSVGRPLATAAILTAAPTRWQASAFPMPCSSTRSYGAEEVGALASRVSVHPAVRGALFTRQRAFATPGGRSGAGRPRYRHGHSARCEGEAVHNRQRAGTRPPPLAGAARARGGDRAFRRWSAISPAATRATWAGPTRRLRPAPDALILDTTAFGKEQAIEVAIEAVEQALPG